jgi:hypothetical protein
MEQETIKKIVSDHFNISIAKMEGKRRFGKQVEARHCAQSLTFTHVGLNKSEIGILYNRDHSSVIHAIKTIKNKVKFDRAFRRSWEALVAKVELEETFQERQARYVRNIEKDENLLRRMEIVRTYKWEARKTA